MNPQQERGHFGPSDRFNPWERIAAPFTQPFAATTTISVALVVLGTVGLVVLNINLAGPAGGVPITASWDVLLRGCATAITIGVLLLVYVSLRRKGSSIEEAYQLGYDIGFENGYRAGRNARTPAVPGVHPAVADLIEDGAIDGGRVVPMKRRDGALG